MTLINLIKKGESKTLEFKETFRYNIKTNEKDKTLKKEVSKAICGMLNSEGGIILIGVADDKSIRGIERDLNLYGRGDESNKIDNVLIDLNAFITTTINIKSKQFIKIDIVEKDRKKIIKIEIKPSNIPFFHSEDEVFYVRDGPRTIKLTKREMGEYISDRSKISPFNTSLITDSKEVHKNMLRAILKNYLIKYYSEVLYPPKDPATNNAVNSLIDKLKDLSDSQVEYFKDNNGSIRHQKMISVYFGGTAGAFKEKINNREIESNGNTRDLPILAGDLALIFFDHYEESLNNEINYLKHIRQDFEGEINRFEFLSEEYDGVRFLNAFKMLEDVYGLIQQFGPQWNDSESLTEWRIINPQKLEEFVQKKSINRILRQIL